MELNVKHTSELTPVELVEIFEARTAVFVVEQACAYQEVDRTDFDALHVRVLNNHQLVAYARLYLSQDGVHFGRVLVVSDERGKGFGRTLLEGVLETIQERFPGQPVHIQAQLYLTPFYASFGFEAVSDEYLEDGIPHVDMTKMS
ncbi:GNAT family N-acetyltransferase [Weissella viridescens]|uniref:GNAT family N-acetyltransferase n=2 Tax=Weissella viridescens TaxID=1629 RepID=A0A3P2RBV7_WEIVI|nr:GNAT family N-acetyltransferase [Weissella viridescens]RRG18063.1 GNAT family N-acetyltransferase [Weissella viridescens]